jgi:hypothetical protein
MLQWRMTLYGMLISISGCAFKCTQTKVIGRWLGSLIRTLSQMKMEMNSELISKFSLVRANCKEMNRVT